LKIAILDNYDSFTYNLHHYLEKVSHVSVDVFLNDKITIEALSAYDKIVLSPGPGLPKDAGIMLAFLNQHAHTHSILGVCLGLQAIGERFGHPLKNLNDVVHGIATPIQHFSNDTLFEAIPKKFKVGRYHSWVIEHRATSELLVTAEDEHHHIMAMKHKTYPICGVQFHPESILSEYGEQLIKNWLTLSR
jgi:anthranilate synthase component II